MVKRKTAIKIRKAHRYLGVFLGIQFLMWTISGMYFSWTDINEIHGDHFKKEIPKIKKIIKSGTLGKIYYCNLFYGNGTARLVRNQKWRDKGLGIIQDLGPHLMDTIKFWFDKNLKFTTVYKNKFKVSISRPNWKDLLIVIKNPYSMLQLHN